MTALVNACLAVADEISELKDELSDLKEAYREVNNYHG